MNHGISQSIRFRRLPCPAEDSLPKSLTPQSGVPSQAFYQDLSRRDRPRRPSLFLCAAYFTTHGARIPGARFNFRIGGNGAAVHRHFLWSFSFLRFASRTFHNASRNFGHGLQFSSLAVAFALDPAPDSLRGCGHTGVGQECQNVL